MIKIWWVAIVCVHCVHVKNFHLYLGPCKIHKITTLIESDLTSLKSETGIL